MRWEDFHTHTCFCDGKDTPKVMVETAWQQGLSAIGLCAHSYTPFDLECCLLERIPFQNTVKALKAEYAGRIEVFCGVEQDFFSSTSTEGFDYVIGSVHYLKNGDHYDGIDVDGATLLRVAQTYYGGDLYAVCEDYYRLVGRLGEKNPDIIGHFDLITKFSEQHPIFDPTHPRYRKAAYEAMEALLPLSVPLEINTGAMSRGYRTTPYPASELLCYWTSHGGSVVQNSDAHSATSLAYGFAEIAPLLHRQNICPLSFAQWLKKR